MKRISALFTLLLIASQTVLHAADAVPKKPNVLVILADDLGYGDVQCYNPERGKIATPHIDRLAAEGMRFTDGHSSSGVCSPSRYTLLTGRSHWRTRLQRGIVGLWEEPLIAPDRLTIASLAKQHGYRTAAFGKWHLGWDWPIPPDRAAVFKERPKGEATASEAHRAVWHDVFSQPIPGGPTARGFDHYFGTDVPNWPPFCFIEDDRTVGIPSQFLPARLLGNNLASNQGPALPDWQLEEILPTLGQRTAKFIAEAAKSPEPFLIYLPLTSPHTPLAVSEAWQGKSGLGRYGDFVMQTDSVVGQVLDALEQSGEADDTLVVFTSDNGCAPYIGAAELEKQGHYPSGPLRGYKSDAWEGGHRVPFVVRWPGVVKPHSTCGQLVHHADIMATLADILDAELPDDAGEDSFSLLPLLRGDDKPVRTSAVSCSANGVPAVRSGSWKLILAPGSGGWSKGDTGQPVQLYNLADDLGETKNLAADQPERVAEMKQLLEKLITDGRSSPGKKQKNDVRVVRYPAEKKAAKDPSAGVPEKGDSKPAGTKAAAKNSAAKNNAAAKKSSSFDEGPLGKVYVYKHSGGEPREIEVFFPPNHDPATAKVPGVILFHGGGWSGGNRGQFRVACDYFASRGLVAATASYRMLSGAEAKQLPPGETRKRVCITDAKSAIRWFKAHAGELGIDPQHIITGGGSAGGHLAVLATTNPGLNDPDDPKDIDTSVVAYVLFNPAFQTEDSQDPEVDALRYLKRNLPPAIVFFGTEDSWKKGWDAVYEKLKTLGNQTTEVQLAEGQAHGYFNREPWRTKTLIAADRFLVKLGLLQGEPTLKDTNHQDTKTPR